MARQGKSIKALAREMGTTDVWLGRRIGVVGNTSLTIEDVENIARALRVPVRQLLLPRLDSNQQPAGSKAKPRLTRPVIATPTLLDAAAS